MLKWHSPSVPLGNSSREEYQNDEVTQCRNSQQVANESQGGKDYIADEMGYVCERKDLDQDDCCIPYLSARYQCKSCIANNCCVIYEHCVSCCMMPDKRPLLEGLIRETVDSLQRIVFASVKDQFELCLSKCRTSSMSVQHENTYRDAKQKHCFGSHVPELHLGVPEVHR